MGIRILSLALLIIAVLSGRAPESQNTTKPVYEDNVLVLGDKTLADAVAQNEFLMLDIYAPWCGHCKTLEPIYARIAKILFDKGSKVVLAKLDGTVEQQTVYHLEVKGYPHLVFYKDGQLDDVYKGERTESDIIEFIQKNTEFPSQYIKTQQELKILQSASQIVLFMSCQSKNDEEFKVFLKYLTYYDDLVFAHSHEESLVGQSPSLVLHNKELKKEFKFNEAYTIANIVDFVEKNTFSVVMNFGLRSAKRIFGQKSKSVFLFYNSNSLHYQDLLEDYFETAQKYVDKIQFCQANQENKQENSIYDYLFLTNDQIPQIRIVDATSKEIKEYVMDEPITELNMLKFLKSYFDNKLTHYNLNQEDIPQMGYKIQPLSGIQFIEFIKEKRLRSVVYFYEDVLHNNNAIYGAIVNNFIGLRPIQFGAVDFFLNLIESFRVYKVPCIFMFGYGKEPVEYFGAMDEKQVSEWIFKVYQQWEKN